MYKTKIIEEKCVLNDTIVNNKDNEYSYIVVNIEDGIKYIQYVLLNINVDDYLKSELDIKYNSFYPFHLNKFFYYQCNDDVDYIINYCSKYLLYNFKDDLINLVDNINNKINILKEFNILKDEEEI